MISALKFTMNTCFCVFTNTFRSGDHIQGDHPTAETLNCKCVGYWQSSRGNKTGRMRSIRIFTKALHFEISWSEVESL